jgi:hypothetical protein
MHILIWFYAKLILGIVAILVGIVGTAHGASKKTGKAALAFIPLIVVGGWLLTGGKIKLGSVEAQSESFVNLAAMLRGNEFAEPDKLIELNNRGVTVWWKLLRYRIELRTLLREICRDVDCHLGKDDVGFEVEIKTLAKLNVIDTLFFDTLNKIRVATYYAEWQVGQPPEPEDIEFALNESPKALTQLIQLRDKVKGKTAPSRHDLN